MSAIEDTTEEVTNIEVSATNPKKTIQNLIGVAEMAVGIAASEMIEEAESVRKALPDENARDLLKVGGGILINQAKSAHISNIGGGIAAGGMVRPVKKVIRWVKGMISGKKSVAVATQVASVTINETGDLF